MKLTLAALAFAAAAATVSMMPLSAQQAACAPDAGLNFICGMKSPEDLVPVPDSRWLIASGMEAGSGLHLIDTQAKTARGLYPGATPGVRADKARFPGCPAPLDPKLALLHGLSLRPSQAGRYTLYATNHGGRQSIEVFELDVRGAAPAATWIGCVVMPDQLEANSVAAFSDGALVATVLVLPGRTFEDVFAGRNTGAVYMWTPGSAAFRRLPGTDLAGNNGIETSPDGREFFVASSGSKRVVAFSRTDTAKPLRMAQLTEFAPDNVRLVGGRLIAAGMIDAEPACGGAPKKPADIQCPRGYVAVSIDPVTMAVTEIVRGARTPLFGGTATAIPVGGDVWLGSFNADRVAYRPLARR